MSSTSFSVLLYAVTLAYPVTVMDFQFYVGATATASMILGLYTDNGSSRPLNLQMSVTFVPTDNTWNLQTFGNLTLPGGVYWLVFTVPSTVSEGYGSASPLAAYQLSQGLRPPSRDNVAGSNPGTAIPPSFFMDSFCGNTPTQTPTITPTLTFTLTPSPTTVLPCPISERFALSTSGNDVSSIPLSGLITNGTNTVLLVEVAIESPIVSVTSVTPSQGNAFTLLPSGDPYIANSNTWWLPPRTWFRYVLLDHVDRDANGARLVGNGARDGLAHPPRSVSGELIASPVLELVHRLHQTDVAFLDQIQELAIHSSSSCTRSSCC